MTKLDAVEYRFFDLERDNATELYDLFRLTYGSDLSYRKRWLWEFEENPHKDRIVILLAQGEGEIAGVTTRLPVDIVMGNTLIEGAFSVNSMIHPGYRRMGIMDRLYKKSFELYPVLLSKGTTPNMYKLLMKLGYRGLGPQSAMTTLLSPVRWLLWRMMGRAIPQGSLENVVEVSPAFEEIHLFGDEFDAFFKGIAGGYEAVVHKTADYMNWRYIDNPLRSYKAFYGRRGGVIESMVVLSGCGIKGKIVDILWNNREKEALSRVVRLSKGYLRKCGYTKMSCWAPYGELKRALKKAWFLERGDFLNLSVFTEDQDFMALARRGRLHVVEGDGDSEYLTV